MLKILRESFTAEPLRNNKGAALIRIGVNLMIITLIVGLIIMGIGYVFQPKYKGAAYVEKDGKRYYQLVRFPDEGIVAGVCAGIGYRFGVDPWVPRAAFLVLTLAGGAGVLVYIIMYLLLDSAHTPPDFLERTGQAVQLKV